MKQKYLYMILIALNVVLLIGATIVIFINKNNDPDFLPQVTKEITLAQVKQHGSSDNCWTIVGSKVYDLTPYISTHPNEQAFIKACGTDGTTLLLPTENTKENSKTSKLLEAYYIGIIAP